MLVKSLIIQSIHRHVISMNLNQILTIDINLVSRGCFLKDFDKLFQRIIKLFNLRLALINTHQIAIFKNVLHFFNGFWI